MIINANIVSSLITAQAGVDSLTVFASLADETITAEAQTSGIISAQAELSDTLTADAELVTTIRISHEGYEDYTGPYEVTSFTAAPLLTTSLVLPTNDKHMTDDVTVFSVPTAEEYNEAGGVTFTIGG